MQVSKALKNRNIKSYSTEQISRLVNKRKNRIFFHEVYEDFKLILPLLVIFYVALSTLFLVIT